MLGDGLDGIHELRDDVVLVPVRLQHVEQLADDVELRQTQPRVEAREVVVAQKRSEMAEVRRLNLLARARPYVEVERDELVRNGIGHGRMPAGRRRHYTDVIARQSAHPGLLKSIPINSMSTRYPAILIIWHFWRKMEARIS